MVKVAVDGKEKYSNNSTLSSYRLCIKEKENYKLHWKILQSAKSPTEHREDVEVFNNLTQTRLWHMNPMASNQILKSRNYTKYLYENSSASYTNT